MQKKIMIRCPVTKKPVFTEIEIAGESFKTSTFEGNVVKCPHCGQTHVWAKKDAFLQ
jgi:4-hydroxy-3-methylbut-2-en-1-yl diphosphate synthase IspG/GcpE